MAVHENLHQRVTADRIGMSHATAFGNTRLHDTAIGRAGIGTDAGVAAFDYMFALLEESASLFTDRSFCMAAFLAITAIQESSSAHFGGWRNSGIHGDFDVDRQRRDGQSAGTPILIGKRLRAVLGRDECARLQLEAARDGFAGVREAAIASDHGPGSYVVPRTAVSPIQAWALLLLAIDQLDDSLDVVGVQLSGRSHCQRARLDELFAEAAALRPDASVTSVCWDFTAAHG